MLGSPNLLARRLVLQRVFEFNAEQLEWGIGKAFSRMQTLRLDSDHSCGKNVLSCRLMIGGEVPNLRRLVHICYGEPRVCVHFFAGVRRQGDLEDADVFCFKSELGMRRICRKRVPWS